MATLVALRAEILEDLKKYNVTNELAIDLQLIDDKIVEANISVLNKFYTSKLSLDGFYQVITGIPVTCEKDKVTIGNFVFTDKTVYYKASPPPIVKTVGYANIKYFGMMGYDKAITRLDLLDFTSRKAARWTGNFPIYTELGDMLIAKNLPEGFSAGLLVAILEDPRTAPDWDDDLSNFPTASTERIKTIVVSRITGTPLLPDLVGGSQTNAAGQGVQKPAKQQQEEE